MSLFYTIVSANTMRGPTDICLLCREKNSVKKNSHLIPKFFAKGIFEGTKPRHGVQVINNGEISKQQDTFKEDFLFCTDCEKGFSIFETYCSLRLGRFDEQRYFDQFKKFKKGEFEYFECNEVDIKVYNLFIYSIIWRISISNHDAFINFKIPANNEEELRNLINNYLMGKQADLLEKIDDLKELPSHSHVMIRPKKKLRPPGSMLSAASLNNTIHQLHLVDYLVFYVTEKDKLFQGFKEIDNNNLERKVRIGLADPKLWRQFNIQLIDKLLK